MAGSASLLRIATAGSVDDGKSTLIGRLLFDSKTIFEDQLSAIERTSQSRGQSAPDLSLLTDGLRAEREQGITIDVAYRYFATPRRKFIIADTPGHIQYTRNMVTGASTADVALILIDARNGVLEQSRRHAFLATLLGIPHLVVCINKMDLVDHSEQRYDAIRTDFRQFAAKLDVGDVAFIPMSALDGDNVVSSGGNMPWYGGTPLLGHLEELHVASDRNLIDARFPVQYVIRPNQSHSTELHDFRGYAGTIAGGTFKRGDEVAVLPSGLTTRIKAVRAPGGATLEEGFVGQSVTIELDDDIDIVRGELLCRPSNRPHSGQDIDAMVCWFDPGHELDASRTYSIVHTTRSTKVSIQSVDYRLDVNTLHRELDASTLQLNDIGRIRLRTQTPIFFDPYRRNRDTGSFILIDEATNSTVAAGMITGPASTSSAVTWHGGAVTRDQRPSNGLTVWLTGLSGSGKSSVAVELERRLVASGRPAYRLDGDNLRLGLNRDLDFSEGARAENVRRAGEVALLLADAGVIAIACLISPSRDARAEVRSRHLEAATPFLEVFMDTPLEICQQRDPKGLYARARSGDVGDFTGVSAPYEPPLAPDLLLRPRDGDAARLAEVVLARIEELF